MNSDVLNLLVLTDLHYTALARHACTHAARQAPLARILIRKALARMTEEGVVPDAIVLLGDLIDNGDAPDALRDLTSLAGELLRTGIPVLAVSGNHDGPPEAVARAFGSPPGLHRIGNFGLLLFQDQRVQGELFARDAAQLALPETTAAQDPACVLLAFQHNPLHPAIPSSYPYMLANGDDVLASYRRAHVALSLSGHYHAGQTAHEVDGTVYATSPALAEAPFSFLHVRMEGRTPTIKTLLLRVETPGLWDIHCHSEFAFCGTTVEAAPALLLSEQLGLAGQGIVEHAFQLYFPQSYAWSFRWQHELERIAEAYRDPRRGRMVAYRHFANGLRTSARVRVGLEVELLGDGTLLLAPEDHEHWDYFLGAIHAVDGLTRGESQANAEALFMRDIDRLLAHPIDVLAHPFRFFERGGLAKPEHLYAAVADRLAARGVAAEINFHVNSPEPEFFRACLERGVKLALGTDSHAIPQVGNLHPHLIFLRALGVDDAHILDVLYRPA